MWITFAKTPQAEPKDLVGQPLRDLLGVPAVTTGWGPHAARFQLLRQLRRLPSAGSKG
jgi:hypothetical protein